MYELEREIVGPIRRFFRVGRGGGKSPEVFAVALGHDPTYEITDSMGVDTSLITRVRPLMRADGVVGLGPVIDP